MWRLLAGTTVALACAAGVVAPAAAPSAPASASVAAAVPVVTATAPAAPGLTAEQLAARTYAAMNATQRVGQIFMAGIPSGGSTYAQRAALRRSAVGNVYLSGGTRIGVAGVRAVTAAARPYATVRGARPFFSVNQEGGQIQRLAGRGFSTVPSALVQGGRTASSLRVSATAWGRQMAAAGVNLNLAPVADVVPAGQAHTNQPIGRYDREYGHTPSRVSLHVAAFVRGMGAGGVTSALKHFPGIGRASANTDLDPRTTDPTRRHDAYLTPFSAGIAAGADVVMVSSARYPNIDSAHIACFSRTVIGTLLRGDLGFRGIVVSDALNAKAMARYSVASRAVVFLAAGGTMILLTESTEVPAMSRAVLARARADARFAAMVKAAVLTVLVVKARAGLLT